MGRHSVRWFGLLVVGFVLSELLVRGASPVLGPPLEFYVPIAQAKVDQVAHQPAPLDILFVGNSTTVEGVDIDAFTAASGRTAYNGGLNGANVHIVRRFTLEELVPRSHPRLVVYGVAPGAFVPGDDAQIKQYDRAPATAVKRPNVLRRLGEHLALFRYRNTLRDPQTLNGLLKAAIGKGTHFGVVDGAERGLDAHGDRVGRSPAGLAPGPIAPPVDDAVVKVPRNGLEDVRRMARRLEAQGSQLVLVDMPRTKRSAGFTSAVRTLAAEVGVPFIDAGGAIADTSSYADAVHLNRVGAKQLGTWLAGALEPYGH